MTMAAPNSNTLQPTDGPYEEFVNSLNLPPLSNEAQDPSTKRTELVEKYSGDQQNVMFSAEPVFRHLITHFYSLGDQPIDEIVRNELRPEDEAADHYKRLFSQFEDVRRLFNDKDALYASVRALDPDIQKEDVTAFRFAPDSVNDFFLQLQLFREFQGRFAEAHMDYKNKDYLPPPSSSRYVSLGPKKHGDADDDLESVWGRLDDLDDDEADGDGGDDYDSVNEPGFGGAWNPEEQEFYIDQSPLMLDHALDVSAYDYLLEFYTYIRDVWPNEWDDDIPIDWRDPARKHRYDEVGILVCTAIYKQYIDSYLEWLDTYPEARGKGVSVPDEGPWEKVVNDAFNEPSNDSKWSEIQLVELEAAALSTGTTEVISVYLANTAPNGDVFTHKGFERFLSKFYSETPSRGVSFDKRTSLRSLLGLDEQKRSSEDAQTIITLKGALHHYCQLLLDPAREKDLIELVGIDLTELPPRTPRGLAEGFATVTDMLRTYVQYAYQEKEDPDAELTPRRSLFTMLGYIEKDVSGAAFLRDHYIPELKNGLARLSRLNPIDTMGNLGQIASIIDSTSQPNQYLFLPINVG